MYIKSKILVVLLIALSIQLAPLYDAYASLFNWLSEQIGMSQDINATSTSYFAFPILRGDSILATNSPPLLTINTVKKPIRVVEVTATAYSSTPDQTDDTPFITASGTYVRDGVIAANFLTIGTIIRIPEIYGNKIFIVEDRMNKRYWHRIDIWFPERQLAKDFGIKTVTIEIIS